MPPCWRRCSSEVYATPAGGEWSWQSRRGWPTMRSLSRPARASSLPACSCGLTWPVRRRASSTPATPRLYGMLERDAAHMNIAAILTASRDMHAREAVQHLTQAVLQESGGQLRDDATALCLDWHGGPARDRDATSGANRERRGDLLYRSTVRLDGS